MCCSHAPTELRRCCRCKIFFWFDFSLVENPYSSREGSGPGPFSMDCSYAPTELRRFCRRDVFFRLDFSLSGVPYSNKEGSGPFRILFSIDCSHPPSELRRCCCRDVVSIRLDFTLVAGPYSSKEGSGPLPQDGSGVPSELRRGCLRDGFSRISSSFVGLPYSNNDDTLSFEGCRLLCKERVDELLVNVNLGSPASPLRRERLEFVLAMNDILSSALSGFE